MKLFSKTAICLLILCPLTLPAAQGIFGGRLDSPLNGNGKTITNLGSVLSSNFIDAATGLPITGVSVNVTNVVYVNPTNGNNATGEKGNPNKPFKTLAVAITNLMPGSVLKASPGQYVITAPLMGLSNNVVFDFEPGAVIINRATTLQGYDAAIVPSSSSRFYNVVITNALRVLDAGVIQFGFGGYLGVGVGTYSTPAFTNVYLENCVNYGDTDGLLFIRLTNACSAILVNCKSYTHGDNIAIFQSSLGLGLGNIPHRVDLYNCIIDTDNAGINDSAVEVAHGLIVHQPGAIVRMFGGSIYSRSDGANTNMTRAVEVGRTNALLELHHVALGSDGLLAGYHVGDGYVVGDIGNIVADNTYLPASRVGTNLSVTRLDAGVIPLESDANLNDFSLTNGNTVIASNLWDKSNVKFWGAKGDDLGVTDDTAAIQACIDYNSPREGIVIVPAGLYRVSSLNLTDRRIEIRGSRNNSYICGGTNGYPIMDFSGSSKCVVRDLIVTSIGFGTTPSCGVLLGRTNISSAGEHVFENVWVYGNYSVAGVYTIASECNGFYNCTFSQGGENTTAHAAFYSAKNATNIYSTPIRSLFQTLVSDGSGGNSLNTFFNCSFLANDGLPASTCLILEYALGHSIQGCFWSSSGPTNQILLQKSAVGISFDACRQEATGAFPGGIRITDSNVYKDVSINASHLFPVTAIGGSTLGNWKFESSYWNGTNGVGIRVLDADVVTDSTFSEGATAPDMGARVDDGLYRISASGLRNRFKGIPISRLEGFADDRVIASRAIISGVGLYLGTDTTYPMIHNSAAATLSIAGHADFTQVVFPYVNVGIGDTTPASLFTVGDGDLFQVSSAGLLTFTDNLRQTFNPGANAAGINVGSIAGDPDTPSNGDLWYDSTANELTARINGANVALGAGAGGADADAIHDNVAGEIAAVTDKATPVAADHLLIEDSAASDAKKDITIGSLEAAMEGLLELQDLQGSLTQAKIDLSALADTELLYNNAGVIATVPQGTFQVSDATLTAVAGLNTTAGVVVQTGTDTFTKRTLTGTANEVAIANGDGVAGAPTFSLPSTLDFSTKTFLGSVVFEGATADAFETDLGVIDPTQDNFPKLPNASGTLVTETNAASLSNKKVTLQGAPGTDDTYTGTDVAGLNAGATVAQWEAVYLSSGSEWVLADANGSGTYPAVALAAAAGTDNNPMTVVVSGIIRNDAWSWTAGGTVYLSATPGALTQTAPSTTGDKVQVIGTALTADLLLLKSSADYGTAP